MGGYQPVTITTAIIDPKISGAPNNDEDDEEDDDDKNKGKDDNENKGNKKGTGPKPMKVQ